MTDPLEILKSLLREKAKSTDPYVSRTARLHITEVEEEQARVVGSVEDGSALVQVIPLSNLPQGEI